ncbi:hypothetical protein ACQEU6_02095 [Spirillospora sp. CA-108201]
MKSIRQDGEIHLQAIEKLRLNREFVPHLASCQDQRTAALLLCP